MPPALSYAGVLAVVVAAAALGYLAWPRRADERREGAWSRLVPAHFEKTVALAGAALVLAVAAIWSVGVRGRRPLIEGAVFVAVGVLGVGYGLIVGRRRRRQR